MSGESTPFREPTSNERRLIEHVARRWQSQSAAWTRTVLVHPLLDDGMGSLSLHLPGQARSHQRFGDCVAEYSFIDTDGVLVLASLYLDQHGTPFELDVWKTDFTSVRRVPP